VLGCACEGSVGSWSCWSIYWPSTCQVSQKLANKWIRQHELNTLTSAGHFGLAEGGQFGSAEPGQFKSAKGGQFHRRLHTEERKVVFYGSKIFEGQSPFETINRVANSPKIPISGTKGCFNGGEFREIFPSFRAVLKWEYWLVYMLIVWLKVGTGL